MTFFFFFFFFFFFAFFQAYEYCNLAVEQLAPNLPPRVSNSYLLLYQTINLTPHPHTHTLDSGRLMKFVFFGGFFCIGICFEQVLRNF